VLTRLPRLVVAAPASGQGKTTVATGLLAAFAARGLTVSPHKVGPDYIDPGYHTLAAGRPGRNLDVVLAGAERVLPLFLHGARGADLAVVEGVMGLFDGAAGGGELASTAQVAKLLGAPVVLVVDASAQARSAAALVHGFATFDPELRLGGVILNRVGSDAHERMLREALAPVGVPVLGALRREEAVAAPSRHLGLVPAAERAPEALASITALGALLARSVDLDAVLALARTAQDLDGLPWEPAAQVGPPEPSRPTVAVFGGAAFTFGYAENTELLAAAGARVVRVDPLRDVALPPDTRGLVVGGGFPELYADRLSANEPLRSAVTSFANSGGAVAAECAGLLYLAESLDGKPMCGVLPARARMTDRLTLGYREAVADADGPLASRGARVRGHEFHRTTLDPVAGRPAAWRLRPGGAEGYVSGAVHASYLHLHWAGYPELARSFVAACAAGPRRPAGTDDAD
jgi:cobyrinic acid a,c-diamide synthase